VNEVLGKLLEVVLQNREEKKRQEREGADE